MLKIYNDANSYLLIIKWENTGLRHLNDSEAFIGYSNYMDDIYRNTKKYNPGKKWKILDWLICLVKKPNPINSNWIIYQR